MSGKCRRIGVDETFEISKALCKTCKVKWDKLLTEDKEAEIEFCKSCQKKIKVIDEKWRNVKLDFLGEVLK